MADVFIAYGRKDGERVREITSALKAAGVSIWMDEFGIDGASLWREEIVRAIKGCHVLILMVSRASIVSENVRREIEVASDSRKSIMPILLEPTEIPDSLVYILTGIQRIDLGTRPWFEIQPTVLRSLQRYGVAARQTPEKTSGLDAEIEEPSSSKLPARPAIGSRPNSVQDDVVVVESRYLHASRESVFFDKLAIIACPYCFHRSRIMDLPFMCTDDSRKSPPCSGILTEFEVCDAVLRKHYEVGYRVSLAGLTDLHGPWYRVDGSGYRTLPLRFLPAVTRRWFGSKKICPRCGTYATERCCGSCHRHLPMQLVNSAPDDWINIGVVGFEGSGKSCLLAAWLKHIGREGTPILSDPAVENLAPSNLSSSSIVPRSTAITALRMDKPCVFHTESRRLHSVVSVHDPSGADIQMLHDHIANFEKMNHQELQHLHLLREANRLVVVVDGMKPAEGCSGASRIIDYIGALRANRPFGAIGVVVSKMDLLVKDVSAKPSITESMRAEARRVIGSQGEGLLKTAVRAVGGDGKRLRVFGVSAIGCASETEQGVASRTQPWGDVEALNWLINPFSF